ncbi:hypothetical protein C0W92_06720 [Photobacterium angustum]|uniref:Uncharacterized protein n=1 Tax=Photobacterium angustum TaxID=661 RepID=A0A855SGX2_PHOAN|nr:hypothetical protein [Photobacterium angustum]KJF82518.1 hypothetical protein UB36_07045 [Photobacterium damselae subsp. damselae]KJG18908.1 hypothetical protein UA33_02390 [Photobacterium angustum]KJG25401.1 hypothetical protein UA39_05580 [Photobacterium angustum]KJG33714.1 hypothetical protein UA36_01630 [Photobacterium angustum]KJG34479.1 hypothetical protein UA69_01440 [Photobacterium angustum]
MKLFACVLGSLIALPSLFNVAQAKTSMDSILESQAIPCSSELRDLATVTLKENPHRMLPYVSKSDDVHLFNALAVTTYRDRQSHVTFHGVKNIEGGCDTSVTESYILQTSCADARHEAFSKWDFEGKLNEHTYVLKSKKIKGKQAFLTEQFSNFCLVTTRQVISN